MTADSYIGYTGAGGTELTNSAGDINTRMGIELVRSEISNMTGNAVDLNATNGSRPIRHAGFDVSGAATGIKTSGTASPMNVSVIRSTITHTTTAVDHGQGTVQLDGSHVNYNNNDFVNNGSGSIVSISNNMVFNNINAPGPVFITPTNIGGK